MKLELHREQSINGATLGRLYADGNVFVCDTLEDEVREIEGQSVQEWKQYGVTAIPGGVYKVEFQNSGRFGPNTLTLLNVPGYTHIRVHAGNTSADTEGCLLLGTRNSNCTVANSRLALKSLKDLCIKAKVQGEAITIKIHKAKP